MKCREPKPEEHLRNPRALTGRGPRLRYNSVSIPSIRALRLVALKEALTEEATTTEDLIVVNQFEKGGIRNTWKAWDQNRNGGGENDGGLYIKSPQAYPPGLAATMVRRVAFGFEHEHKPFQEDTPCSESWAAHGVFACGSKRT